MRMITVGEPGADQFGQVSASDGVSYSPMAEWSSDAISSHVQGYQQARRNYDDLHTGWFLLGDVQLRQFRLTG